MDEKELEELSELYKKKFYIFAKNFEGRCSEEMFYSINLAFSIAMGLEILDEKEVKEIILRSVKEAKKIYHTSLS